MKPGLSSSISISIDLGGCRVTLIPIPGRDGQFLVTDGEYSGTFDRDGASKFLNDRASPRVWSRRLRNALRGSCEFPGGGESLVRELVAPMLFSPAPWYRGQPCKNIAI